MSVHIAEAQCAHPLGWREMVEHLVVVREVVGGGNWAAFGSMPIPFRVFLSPVQEA